MTDDLDAGEQTVPRSFSRLDMAFASFLSQRTRFDSLQKQAFEAIGMMASYEQNQGHSCIKIDDNARALLLASGLVAATPDNQSKPLPLVIEQDRLYLHRYWNYENQLAMQIKAMIQAEHPAEQLDAMLDRYFEASDRNRRPARGGQNGSPAVILHHYRRAGNRQNLYRR